MILDLLKTQTSHQHKRIEANLNLFDHAANVDEYCGLLARFFGFYAPLEPHVSVIIQTAGVNFDYAPRLKNPLLRTDLFALGLNDEQLQRLPVCRKLPSLETPADVFGYLYVAEGSTLGGQLIARHFARTLQLDETNGALFFHAYGKNTGKMWREFGAAITTFAASGEHESEILTAAIETFETLENWMKK